MTFNEQIQSDDDSDSGSSTCSIAHGGPDLRDDRPRDVLCDDSIREDQCPYVNANSCVDNQVWDFIDDFEVLSSSDSGAESEAPLSEGLVKWLNKHDVKRTAADDLLKLLKSHGHGSLPSSARTLLKTDRMVVSAEKSGMKYIYLGIENAIITNFDKYPSEIKQSTNRLPIALNIDGLPLFRSSNTVLWPVLCRNSHTAFHGVSHYSNMWYI